MHIKVYKEALQSLLKTVIPATNEKSPIPAHACFLIKATIEGVLYASAGDNRLSISYNCLCEAKKAGLFGVNAKLLSDAVDKLSGQYLTLSSTEARLKIASDKASVSIPVLSADVMMMPPNYHEIVYMDFPKFFDMFESVAFAAVHDEAPGIFGGVNLQSNKAIATDRNRLAMVAHDYPVSTPMVLPTEGIMKLRKVMGPDVSVGTKGSHIFFKEGTSKHASVTMLEGKYPDVLRVIPSGPFMTVVVSKNELKEALKLAEVTADKKAFTIVFEFKDGKLLVRSNSEMGDGVQAVDASMPEGEPDYQIALSGKYMLQTLEYLNEDKVTLEVRSPVVPLVIKENGYVNIIMPRRQS